jgi:hypothetical protein
MQSPVALRQRLYRKKRAPINNRSLYKIEHSKVTFEHVARGNSAETDRKPKSRLKRISYEKRRERSAKVVDLMLV